MRVLPALALFLALAAPAAAQSSAAPPTPGVAAGGTVEGVVTNAETGQPVAGAGVVIPALGIGAMTDREGRYAIEGVPPGEHTVRAGAFTYHMTSYAVTVAEGGAVRLDAPLAPGAGAGCAAIHPGDHGEQDTAP